jgi:molybdopterin-binding protein
MRLSARNQIRGIVLDVVKGATTSHVTVEISGGQKFVASITNEAVAELGLAKGKNATIVVKASDVMIGVE